MSVNRRNGNGSSKPQQPFLVSLRGYFLSHPPKQLGTVLLSPGRSGLIETPTQPLTEWFGLSPAKFADELESGEIMQENLVGAGGFYVLFWRQSQGFLLLGNSKRLDKPKPNPMT